MFGIGIVNNEVAGYRIDLDDRGPFGSGSDAFTIRTTSGYMSGGVLLWGDVVIQ